MTHTPNDIIDVAGGFADSVLLGYAVEHQLFEHTRRPATTAALAARLRVHAGKLEPVLVALSGLELLQRAEDGRWSNAAATRSHLVEGAPDDLRPFVCHMVQQWRRWIDLPKLLVGLPRDDHQDRSVFNDCEGQALLLKSTAAEAGTLPDDLAALLPSNIQGLLVDAGGGHGRYAAAALALHHKLRAEVWDTQLTALTVAGPPGITYVGCDLLDASTWPSQSPSVVILANVIANFSATRSQRLIHDLVGRLTDDGIMVVVTPWLDRDRQSPQTSCLFGVIITTACDEAWLPGVDECESWLHTESLVVERHRVDDDAILIGRRVTQC